MPPYEGNVRSESSEVFGGLGGDGADGRILIEVPRNSNIRQGGVGQFLNDNTVTTGLILINVEESFAFSIPLRLGVGPAQAVFAHSLELDTPIVRFSEFGLPASTEAVVLWQGALESRDSYAEINPFGDGVLIPACLQDFDFIRFRANLLSNVVTGQVPSIQSIQLKYRLKQ